MEEHNQHKRRREHRRYRNNQTSTVQLQSPRPTPYITYRNARLLALSVVLALTSLSFFFVPSLHVIVHSNKNESPPNWSKRKISSASIGGVGPVDQGSHIFLKKGSASTKFHAGMLPKSDRPAVPRASASKRRKENRLIRGTHLSLAEMNGWPAMEELIGSDGNVASHEDIS